MKWRINTISFLEVFVSNFIRIINNTKGSKVKKYLDVVQNSVFALITLFLDKTLLAKIL